MNKQLFTNNFWLKLLALALATATWTFVNDLASKEKLFKIPVKILHADTMIVTSRSMDFLTLKVKGPAGVINIINADSFTIEKDLIDIHQPGTITIPVQDMNITLPKHVTIEDFFPTRMTIKLDQIIEKEFKVNVVTTGSPSPGFTLLDSHRINPAVITLKGPEQLLKDKDTVNTVPIDISGLVASKKFTAVHLEPFRSDIDLNNDKFVEVTIRILEKNIDRSFLKIPVQALGTVKTLYKIEISSTEVDITLRGKEEALDAIRPADIKIFFDITDLAIGVYDLPLEGRIPDKYLLQGVTILDIKPATIEATISEKQ